MLMQPVGTDLDGHPIPGVPEPGDRIRVLWASRGDMKQHWDNAYLVELTITGLWWAMTDDYSGAIWSPWSHIVSIEGPTP